MLANYLLVAWRNILSNRLFSAINILGLAIGIMSYILILLFVRYETSYDNWLPNADRVVRLHSAFYPPERPPFLTVNSAGRMKDAIVAMAPDLVENGVRLLEDQTTVIRDGSAFTEHLILSEAGFFEVLPLPFLHGSPDTSFTKPLDLVISERIAIKYFGRTDVVGETLTVCCFEEGPTEVQITGVIQNLPENTHLRLDVLAFFDPSMYANAPNILDTWTSVNTRSYFLLKEGASAADLKARLDTWLDAESPLLQMVPPGMKPTELVDLKFMPLLDIHLHAIRDAGSMGDYQPLGDITQIYAFSGVALAILLIASINFMNLSTARASRRAREVAMRKVMGASRTQVIAQFIGESVVITTLALIVALAAVEVALPAYNDAIERNLALTVFTEPTALLSVIALTLVVGVLAGSYPAFFLSRFMPAESLKSKQGGDGGQGRIRAALVVFQFAVSIGLAVCTVVIYGQTLFAQNLDLGYQHEGKLALMGLNARGVFEQKQAIVNELERLPGVTSVVLSSEVPSQDRENNTGFTLLNPPAGATTDQTILNYHTVGFGFFEAYEMRMIAGRTFNESYGTDEIVAMPEDAEEPGNSTIVINESAARQLGFQDPASAVGYTLRADLFRAGLYELEIVGVAEDVYFRSIKFGVRPSVYFNYPPALQTATLTYATTDVSGLIADVNDAWSELLPETPINLDFVSQMVRAQYESEQRQAELFAAFSILAVVVACLGLYGLASFSAERRTREIGIRKVMGARVRDIVRLLVWQFSMPVLLANAVAWPVAFYVMHQWLEGFSYRIDSGFILLASLLAGIVALVIAWATVAGHALKVASENPIHALRYE